MSSRLVWPVRILIAIAVAVVLSMVPYRAMGGNQKRKDMNRELAKIESEIAERSRDLVRRRRLVKALKSDTRAIEKIARDELNMLYPHEKTLRLERRSQ